MAEFTIKIKPFTPGASVENVTVNGDMTIRQLKDKIFGLAMTDSANFRLLLAGRQLANDATLSSLNISQGTVLYLVNKPEQEPSAAATASTTTSTNSSSQPAAQPSSSATTAAAAAAATTTTTTTTAAQRPGQTQRRNNDAAANNNNPLASLLGLPGGMVSGPVGPVESSFVVGNNPPPTRWLPNQIQNQITNAWVPETTYNALVDLPRPHVTHRLPYSSSLVSQTMAMGSTEPIFQQDVSYMSRGFEDESVQSLTDPQEPVNPTITNADQQGQRTIDYTRPPRQLPDSINAYAYPLHSILQTFDDARSLIESVRDRIAQEENITTVEEIASLRYDARRLGSLLRSFWYYL
eukprot:UN00059